MRASERSSFVTWIPSLASAVIIAASIAVGLIAFWPLQTPRARILLGSICWAELLLGAAWGALLDSRDGERGLSSAMAAILAGVTSAYAVVLVIALALVALEVPSTRDLSLHVMIVVLIAFSAIWLATSASLYSHDLRMTAVMASTTAAQAFHVELSKRIHGALAQFDYCPTDAYEVRQKLDRLHKRLSAVETALAHSHGGNGGEHRTPAPAARRDSDAELQSATGRLVELATQLRSGSPDAMPGTLTALDECATRLIANVTTRELQ